MSAMSRVIVGVSASPRNLPALRFSAALARSHDAALVPLLCWAPPGGELADRRCPSPFLRLEWEHAAWQRLQDSLCAAFGCVPYDVTIGQLVVRGEAGRVLVESASQADDILVIGTGRQGSLGRLRGGQVSRYCLAHALCPVLAVPPSPLLLEARHGWAFRHRGLSPKDLDTSAVSDSPERKT